MRNWRILIALLLLGLSSWYLVVSNDTSTAGAPHEQYTSADLEETPRPSETETVTPASTATNTRSELEHSTDVNDNTLELHVHRFDSGKPISGALVGFFEKTIDWDELSTNARALLGEDEEQFYAKYGKRVTTDSRGACVLPKSKYYSTVIARFGDLYGQGWPDPDRWESLTILLRRDQTLRVHVVDAFGAPAAGVSVRGDPSHYGYLGETNDKGTFTLRHSQTFSTPGQRDHRRTDQGREGDGLTQIFATALGGKSERVEVDLAVPPKDPVRLTLPPTGSVEFRVLKASGAPCNPADLSSRCLRIGVFDKKPSRGGTPVADHALATIGPDGRARIRHVCLGKHLSVHHPRLMRQRQVFAGPTTQNELVVVPIRQTPEDVVFVGRAVDKSGRPFPKHRFQLAYRSPRGMGSEKTKTDGHGRFAVRMTWMKQGQEVSIYAYISKNEHHSERLFAQLCNSWKVVDGENNLGDMVFREDPVVLEGRVVFPEGSKTTQLRWSVEEVRLRSMRRAPDFSISEEMSERMWSPALDFSTSWQDNGMFKVRGPFDPDIRYRLRFRPGLFCPMVPLEFRPGTEGVEIRLEVAASLTAVFLVDGKTPWRDFEFSLVLESARESRHRIHWLQGRHLPTFKPRSVSRDRLESESVGLLAGTYRLEVRCEDTRQEVVTIPGIQAIDGKRVEDSRLEGIDLRSKAHYIEITARGPEGKIVKDQHAWVLFSDPSHERRFGRNLRAGSVRLTITGPLDLHAYVPGALMTMVKGVTKDCEIQLEVAPMLRFRLCPKSPLPDGVTLGLQLQLTPDLVSRNPQLSFADAGSGPTPGQDGTIIFRPTIRGEHSLRLLFNRAGRQVYAEGMTPEAVTVGANHTELIEVTIPTATIEKALGALDERRP